MVPTFRLHGGTVCYTRRFYTQRQALKLHRQHRQLDANCSTSAARYSNAHKPTQPIGMLRITVSHATFCHRTIFKSPSWHGTLVFDTPSGTCCMCKTSIPLAHKNRSWPQRTTTCAYPLPYCQGPPSETHILPSYYEGVVHTQSPLLIHTRSHSWAGTCISHSFHARWVNQNTPQTNVSEKPSRTDIM